MRNWLQTKIGVTNLPLFYFICKDTTPLTMDHSEFIIYNASLTASVFKADSRKVKNILTPLVLYTDAFEWVGRKFSQSKGKEECIDLVSHYNVSSKSEFRIDVSRHKLSNLFYKNYITFNFETFCTKLKATLDVMEKYGEVRSKVKKVITFLEKIRMMNQKLESEITFCRSNHNGNYLSETN